MPSSRAAARTAQQPGLILAAAWVGGKLGGCHGFSMAVSDERCGVWRLGQGVRWWSIALENCQAKSDRVMLVAVGNLAIELGQHKSHNNIMHTVRSIWGTYGYGLGGNPIQGTPEHRFVEEAGKRLISTLKRDILLFDSIYVVPVEFSTVLRRVSLEVRDDLSMLKDKSLIRTYNEWFEPPEIDGEFNRVRLTPLEQKTKHLWDVFKVVQGCLVVMATDLPPLFFEKSESSLRIMAAMNEMGIEKASQLYFELGKLTHDFQTRFHAEYLQKHRALDVIPSLDKSAPECDFLDLRLGSNIDGNSKHDVVNVCLDFLPFPDLSASWDDLIEYRNDNEVRKNFLALRKWLRKMAEQPSNLNDLREEVEYLILERESHLKLRELKINTGSLETVLTIGAGVLENIAKLNLSSAVKTLFTLTHRKIELLEAEQNAPGKDIAYITSIRKRFG
ncbi:MAG: hypothetical protein ACK5RA_15140 [Cyanobacteriota bacterium]